MDKLNKNNCRKQLEDLDNEELLFIEDKNIIENYVCNDITVIYDKMKTEKGRIILFQEKFWDNLILESYGDKDEFEVTKLIDLKDDIMYVLRQSIIRKYVMSFVDISELILFVIVCCKRSDELKGFGNVLKEDSKQIVRNHLTIKEFKVFYNVLLTL